MFGQISLKMLVESLISYNFFALFKNSLICFLSVSTAPPSVMQVGLRGSCIILVEFCGSHSPHYFRGSVG